ncbi:MAG TPA: DUF302 domain-containing protein [Candidatus Nitrosotalea sp.]|nr:DUF302 domain-containing protein [Candidatus Nitrosotalea sp.]
MNEFSYSTKTSKSIDNVIEDLTVSLKDAGFGILGTLNFKEIFQKKNIDYPLEYRLLEVCNPTAAKHVLEINPEIGLLLPCTIAVYQKGDENWISLARPTSLLSIANDKNLQPFGQEIEQKLIQAINKSK